MLHVQETPVFIPLKRISTSLPLWVPNPGYVRAGWYHWRVDDVAGEIRGALEPYRASTARVPLPRVLLYTPALTLHQSTQEEQNQMILSLILVRIKAVPQSKPL